MKKLLEKDRWSVWFSPTHLWIGFSFGMGQIRLFLPFLNIGYIYKWSKIGTSS